MIQERMKIALLTMYYDNNYGGNLQRYALVNILEELGYDVTCLYIRQNWNHYGLKYWIWNTLKQLIKHYLLQRRNEEICLWKDEKESYIQQTLITEPFYERYIPHTDVLYGDWWLKRYAKKNRYDAYIVGSDQVWRKMYVQRFGLGTWFFDFLPDGYVGKRIAYGASFGVSEPEYTKEEQNVIRPLFKRFDAVSVREQSGMDLLKQYGWTSPEASCVLDPTLLLKAEDYNLLIENADTKPLAGKLLCYILDMNEEKELLINQKSKEHNLFPTILSSGKDAKASVEQWLRSFRDAEYVITDSYHGLLFALIYHKPYHLIVNRSRGASRFESMERQLNFHINEPMEWDKLDKQLDIIRNQSIRFLKCAIES